MKNKSHTPHEDVNLILTHVLGAVSQILGEGFVGMYLFGSLANGDFDRSSDVDILVVTNAEVSDVLFASLHAMHRRLARLDSPWANQLEVSYIPQNALRRFNASNNIHPHLDRGNDEKLHLMLHASDWIIQRHTMYERGISVAGPDLRGLIDPVSSEDLKWAVVDVLPLWTDSLLKDPLQEIRPRGYQSFIVLSLCRMLYTIQNGAVASKIVAATWALQALDVKWQTLIERAIVGRQNAGQEVDAEDRASTLDFIHYTIDQCQEFEKSNNMPTRYPDVNQLLNLLLQGAKEILGGQFVGMYLYGSLSSGDFDPASSDIDFVVVTAGILPAAAISALEAMHTRLWSSGLSWASKLEGAYLPKELIRRHDPNGPACPNINEGRFMVDGRGSDWIIQRHVIREYGVVLEGPDPKTLIDFVTPADIRGSVLGVLQEWWFPMLDDPAWLREHRQGDHAFAVLTMCRVLHALENGTIVSKPKAVQWAREQLGQAWQPLLTKAVAAAAHEEQDDFLDETLSFIGFVKDTVRGMQAREG